MVDLDRIVNVREFEELARERMEPGAFDYYAGGAGDEVTVQENARAFDRYRFRPRVLTGVADVKPQTSFLGTQVDIPIGLAPTALHRLAHPEGEAATARAAARWNVMMCVSTESSCSLEEVAQAAAGPKWFQLYIHKERDRSVELIERAEAAGYEAVVLTVDLPVVGYRDRELRNSYVVPDEASPGNFPVDPTIPLIERIGHQYDPLRWEDIAWLRARTSLPILAKGIQRGDDAALAIEAGVDGIIVSNHGGRQLDRTMATLDALVEVVSEVGDRVELYVDGGVRRGTDAVIALALGARGAFIGRPYLWGLAAAGQTGVERVLEILHAEFVNALTLLGVDSPSALSTGYLRPS